MPDLDLKSALQMFQTGAKDLMFSRALSGANDTVQQIKASEANEQQQRAQMQQVSNQLVMQMAQLNVPETTMAHVSQAIMGPRMTNANEIAAQANLTGNSQLLDSAKKQQDFEFNLEDKRALAMSRASVMAQTGLAKQEQAKQQFAVKQFNSFSKDTDKSVASSRSAFGQWSSVSARGERLKAILGNPSDWHNMTVEQLELVKEGVVQMSKGGVMTQEEHKVLSPLLLKVKAAQAESAVSGKPVGLDLSGYANLYNNIIDKEGDVANKAAKDIILTRATGNMKLEDIDSNQFKATISDRLNKQAGLNVSPDDIVVDRKKGVSIKDGAKPAQKSPGLVPVMVQGPNGLIKALKDPVTGKLFAE